MIQANENSQLKQLLSQGRSQADSQESENQHLKSQLVDFQEQIKVIKGQLESMKQVQRNNEMVREKADEFV